MDNYSHVSCNCNCNECHPPICPSDPCYPSIPFTPKMLQELNKTFITVQTIAQRNMLNKSIVVNGRIVKVVDSGDGTAKFYKWNQAIEEWEIEAFESVLTDYVTQLMLQNELTPIQENINDLQWQIMNPVEG